VTRDIESGSGVRASVFPEDWGPPEGRPYSEQRAAWVRRNVRSTSSRRRFVGWRRLTGGYWRFCDPLSSTAAPRAPDLD
jgi:hypothetical protein